MPHAFVRSRYEILTDQIDLLERMEAAKDAIESEQFCTETAVRVYRLALNDYLYHRDRLQFH